MKLQITDAQREMMLRSLEKAVLGIPTRTPDLLISEYAERRVLPPGSPRPGRWSNDLTPYWVEPMNNMSPSSVVQREIMLKSAQAGATAIAENVLCFYMDVMPSDILFMSANEKLLERWATRRLERAIDSFGFRNRIYSSVENSKSRRTGDKTFSKEYGGCQLDLASARSASQQRATDKRVLVRDEVDGAPEQLTTGEGNFLDVSWARTNSWGNRRKVLDFSTPTTYDTSLMWRAYLEGDQRKFHVPCPLCGSFQELQFGDERTQYGLKADMKAGQLERAYYLCDHCHDAIFEHHKLLTFQGGHWVPTTATSNPHWRSRHISSLYSNFMTWEELWRNWDAAKKKPDGMRAFTNLYGGMPYRETGSRPKMDNVIELRGGYTRGTVQPGVIYLTIGVDVQRGSTQEGKLPARLELEVLGTGKGYRTWSVDYHVIEGEVDDPYSGAWEKLNQMAVDGAFTYQLADGRIMTPRMVLVDSGDMGEHTHTVIRFCDRWANTFPSKGFATLKRHNNEGVDPASAKDHLRYRVSRMKDGEKFYAISTNYYKRLVYGNLKLQRTETGDMPPGYCAFPLDYHDRYFEMLTAEEMRQDGSFAAGGRRNEALDCRVMALCAADIFLDSLVESMRASARLQGVSEVDTSQIGKIDALEWLSRNC
jgi:phage terminase large subunit GpA-like protein